MADEYLLVLTTCGDAATARRMAGSLVAERLAACVNIVPGVESVYRWNGDIQHDQEVVLLIKTVAYRFDELTDASRRLSAYELPEVVAVSIEAGLDGYLNWVSTAVTGSDPVPE